MFKHCWYSYCINVDWFCSRPIHKVKTQNKTIITNPAKIKLVGRRNMTKGRKHKIWQT